MVAVLIFAVAGGSGASITIVDVAVIVSAVTGLVNVLVNVLKRKY